MAYRSHTALEANADPRLPIPDSRSPIPDSRAVKPFPLALALLTIAACKDTVSPTKQTPTPPNPQHVSVVTQHNDRYRTGWNASESALTTANVNVTQFGKLFALQVNDQTYAQPLVVGGVQIGGAAHNVVYVATVANTLYAFDGDDGTLYWQKSYTAPGMRPVAGSDMTGACGGRYSDFSGNMGIVGTPVIDSARGTMYFVARSAQSGTYVQYLHAVSIADGSDVVPPTRITATYAGIGDGNVNGTITFDSQHQNQRQALTLLDGVVYVTFSSHCDWKPYHGWILGYDAASLQQQVVWNATPNGAQGGMWESGMGMAADDAGNLFVVTGNGTVGTASDPSALPDRGESALKLVRSGSTLNIATWFTPLDYPFLNSQDLDYGGLGGFLIPSSKYFLTGAKDGHLYLLDKDDMGGIDLSSNRVQQSILLGTSAKMHAQAAYYGGAKEYVYVWSENDPLRAIPFDRASGLLDMGSATNFGRGGPTGESGAVLSVSSNGSSSGSAILWAAYASSGDAEHAVSPGILRAFDAMDVSKELWNNQQNAARDGAGNFAKFASPTIANGKVYLPTFSDQVVVYGLLGG